MSNSEEFLMLTADARDKMNKFHAVVYKSMAAHISPLPYDAVKDVGNLKINSPEGVAYKEAVKRLRIYKAAE